MSDLLAKGQWKTASKHEKAVAYDLRAAERIRRCGTSRWAAEHRTQRFLWRYCRRRDCPGCGPRHARKNALRVAEAHAALFGVNPWRLQAWLGHKRIDETMRYVHVVEAHPRELPKCVQVAAQGIGDPDRRVLAMLGARGSVVAAATSASAEAKATA